MKQSQMDAFPPGVAEKLKTYVYRLIDPRNGETFYVGKGKGNRLFSHVRAEIDDDALGHKLKRIHEIQLAGFEVAHVIHRHGMDDKTAMEVEAALIDAYPGLTNQVAGSGSGDYGAMHALEIVRKYCAEPAVFRHRAILINVNRTAEETSLYEATRYAWRLKKPKAEKAQVVLAVRQGLIVGAFIAEKWLEATPANFPNRSVYDADRFGFIGYEAPADLRKLYVGKRVPDEYRKPGASNPIKYTWKKHVASRCSSSLIAEADYIPTREQADAVIGFLPIFESPDFVPSILETPAGVFPYHVFADELSQFHEAVYKNGFVCSFDWGEWVDEAHRYCENPSLLATADLQTLRMLITFHVRKQRFVDGHLPEMVKCGQIAGILRRLKELRAT